MAQSCAVSKVSKSIWGFDPTTISGCVLWLDGKDGNTIPTAVDGNTPANPGGSVIQWRDKSIMQNHAIQSSGGTLPTRSNDGGIMFDIFYSSALELQRPNDLPIGTTNGTYFTVSRGATGAGDDPAGGIIIGHGDYNIDSSSRAIFETDLQRGVFITGGFGYKGTNPISDSQAGIPPVTESNIITLSVNNLIGSLWVSGIPANITNVDLQDTSVQVNTAGPVFIGRGQLYTNGTGSILPIYYYTGTIYEILVYNSALSNTDRQTVEGYLALKWGLQLPIDHPYFFSVYQPRSRSFVPTDIDGCQLWMDPADSRAVTLTGANVTSVADKSGLGNTLTNSSSSITYASTINGLPVLTFPTGGASNSLDTPPLTRDGAKRTYFFVIKYSSTVASSTVFVEYKVSATAQDSLRHHGTTNQSKTLDFTPTLIGTIKASQTYNDATFRSLTSSQFYGGKICVLSCVRDRENYTFSTNGVSVTQIGNPVPDTTSGGFYDIVAGSSDHQVGDVIIYNSALTDCELTQVEGYLMWKWGVRRGVDSAVISIPTTHPYYKFPADSITPKQPQRMLYKTKFDPSDLSPVIWLDPLDTSKVTTVNNRITQIKNKGSLNLPFVPPAGINGPLVTQSAVGDGVGQRYLDFSNGGNFYVTAADIGSSTNLSLTTSIPHQIPVGAFVTLTVSTGTYTGGASATINSGPFQILSGQVDSTGVASVRRFTFTTASNHGITSGQSIFLINRSSTFFGRASSASLGGAYSTVSGTSATTVIFDATSAAPTGLMRIEDMSVRNNTGTTGYYNTAAGTTGTTVNLTSHLSRPNGALSNLTANINYGQIPFTSVNYTGGNATIETPINHGIPSGATVGVCSNNSLCMPFQSGINPISAAAGTIIGTIDTRSGYVEISITSNPFFMGTMANRVYSGVSIILTLFPGTTVTGRSTINTVTTISTTTRSESSATKIAFNMPSQLATNAVVTPTGQAAIIHSVSATKPLNSSYINTTATVTIPTTSSISYPINRGLGNERDGRLLNTRTNPISLADTADVNNGYILYPVRGCALENTALGSNLNTDKMTIIWASCLTGGYSRNNFSDVNVQSSVISAAVTTNGGGGRDSGGQDFRIQTSSRGVNTSRMSIIRGSTGGGVSPALVPGGRVLTNGTSHFRINHAIMNLSGTAVDDIPANTHAMGTNGWGYASQFANSGARASAGGQTAVTLAPTHLRIGANTNAGSPVITTIAGTGVAGSVGNGTTGTSAQLDSPFGVNVDAAGNVYIADTLNHRVRMIPVANGSKFEQNMIANYIYTIAGTGVDGFNANGITGTSAQLNFSVGVASDTAGNVYIADTFNDRVRMIPVATGLKFGQNMNANYIYTIGGTGTSGFNGNGITGTSARLSAPYRVASDTAGNVYIADTENHRVRMIPVANGSKFGQNMIANYIYTIAGTGTAGSVGNGITGTSAQLNFPSGVASDTAGNVYIADSTNHRVRMIPVANGSKFGQNMIANYIYTIAGTGTAGSVGNGTTGTSAQLNNPFAVASDTAGNVYIADTNNHRIRMIPVATGLKFGQNMNANYIYTIAGTGVDGFNGDDKAPTSAQLNFPAGVDVDAAGNVYIADTDNHRIRMIAPTDIYSDYPLTSHWYEGGLGDLMIFNSVLTFEERKLVEGYMAEKYRCNEFLGGLTNAAGSFLHPYRASPTEISSTVDLSKIYSQGVAAWFDAANTSTIVDVDDNGLVRRSWVSISGDIAVATAGARLPTVVENVQNGLSGLRFPIIGINGSPIGTSTFTGGYVIPITRFSTLSENNEYTIISVYKQTTYVATRMICNILTTNASSRLSVFTDKFTYKSDATEQTNTYNPASVGNTVYLLVNYRRGSTMYARRNGTSVGTTTGTDLTITGNNFGIVFGAISVGSQSTNPFEGDIYETIIFRHALTDQAIFQIEGYLAWKWGLNGSLPETHPYYSVIT